MVMGGCRKYGKNVHDRRSLEVYVALCRYGRSTSMDEAGSALKGYWREWKVWEELEAEVKKKGGL